jgi:pimeloyl-ACP methyl ester carboxylesterase
VKTMPLLITSLWLGSIAGCYSGSRDDVSARTVDSDKETMDNRVTSKDGARIAFEKVGSGPPVILVNGALAHRGLYGDKPLAAKLSEHFTVYIYDRRGRGESTDVPPYAAEREIEDIAALISHAGKSAGLYGVSSGAALAMQAAAKLGQGQVPRLAIYEPPYGQDLQAFAEQRQRISELVRTGQPGEAAAFFLAAIGTPPEVIEGMKRSGEWEAIKKIDFTLAYDFAVLGDGAVPADTAREIAVPTLVMDGDASMAFMRPTADRIATLIPRAERKTLKGQTHQVAADVLAPHLIEFFTRSYPKK